jgi:hypothetical protein
VAALIFGRAMSERLELCFAPPCDAIGLRCSSYFGAVGNVFLVRRGFERLAGKTEDGAFYLTQAMGGGLIHSLIAFGLLAADPALRSDSRFEGGGI